jgi:signal transduction histidine kinase
LDLEIIRPDGTNHWISARGEAVVDGNGNPIYLRGTAQDITSRKLSEAALVAMSGRLINAQEEERVRIARELHDDLSQRMALLSIKVEQFEQGIPDLSFESKQQVRGVSELASEVSSTLYDLTHRKPVRLDGLGLVTSWLACAGEFGVQHNLNVQFVRVTFRARFKGMSLPIQIVQEALRM